MYIQQGNTLYENVFGDKGSNNAGEYLAVDPINGDVMIFVDSDTLGGAFGFLKLTPNHQQSSGLSNSYLIGSKTETEANFDSAGDYETTTTIETEAEEETKSQPVSSTIEKATTTIKLTKGKHNYIFYMSAKNLNLRIDSCGRGNSYWSH